MSIVTKIYASKNTYTRSLKKYFQHIFQRHLQSVNFFSFSYLQVVIFESFSVIFSFLIMCHYLSPITVSYSLISSSSLALLYEMCFHLLSIVGERFVSLQSSDFDIMKDTIKNSCNIFMAVFKKIFFHVQSRFQTL